MITDINIILQLIKSKKVLVFDFDGVLADSVEVKTEAFAQIYSEYGEDVINNVIDHHRENGGMSRFEKFKFYHKEFLNKVLSEKELIKMANKFSGLVVKKVIDSKEIPQASKFLKQQFNTEKVIAINSATPEEEIKTIVRSRSIDKYFSVVLGSPSSKEENLRSILKILKVDKDEAIFFGDASSDLEASELVEIDFIGIGSNLIDKLNGSKKHFHMNDFKKITKLSEIRMKQKI
tara:strand:+ start:36 stop:737 length:702 start_codon:yes stop_codon:yes gene_type:complete